jgi:hypothetical protein
MADKSVSTPPSKRNGVFVPDFGLDGFGFA